MLPYLLSKKGMKNLLFCFTSVLLGIAIGIGIGTTQKIGIISRSTTSIETALPTRLLDRNGKLITTFFSLENRKIITFQNIPKILMQALITREDQSFFNHSGFSIRGTLRAAINILLNRYVSGGSTISQQVAGEKYADRREFSIKRKLKELWWSFQLERSWSKQEILEEYLNKMYFGHGNYGVETASQFFFGHSAKYCNSAEAVMLMILLASPGRYSPFKNPNLARERQETILQQMASLGFLSQEQIEREVQLYWDNFDYTREGISSAFLERDDKAPYFSEYIRYLLLEELGYTDDEINTGGLTIYTTLDLEFQNEARKNFDIGLEKANRIYARNTSSTSSKQDAILPIAALSSLLFDGSNDFFHKSSLIEQRALSHFTNTIQPTLSMLHLMFEPSPNSLLANITKEAIEYKKLKNMEETVEGAMITIDNSNGHILTMIGGSSFDVTNQFNRAIDAFVQPGSSFKPLYYAAGIENKIITPSTIIWDSPAVFFYDEGETYVPRNYKGEWKGPVSVRRALANSMNVPSLKVLNMVGFEKTLDIAGRLLRIPEKERERYGLVEKYPVGLGIVSISPLSMANAYATIANKGTALPNIAIRYIEDRNGTVIQNVEDDLRREENKKSQNVLTPQAAYVVSSLLQSTVSQGTLRYASNLAGGFTQPTAGKTGTTQNWSDSWTLGFTPYFTTALWFGFDRGGQSLGTNQTGAVTTGPVWAKYMEAINKDLPRKEFSKPNGIITLNINPENNTLATAHSQKRTYEIFIVGTEPRVRDNTVKATIQDDYAAAQLQTSSWNMRIPFNQEGKFDRTLLKLAGSEDGFPDLISGKITLPTRPFTFASKKSSSIDLTLKVPSRETMLDFNHSTPLSSNVQESSDEDEEVNPFLQ